jgi:two-component system phosphate regulon sensor histidine kinase PhoR
MILLITFMVLFSAALWGTLLSGRFEARMAENLKNLRISLIDAGGEVLFDNSADAASLDNHKDRSEVRAAAQTGFGESKRVSATSGQTTYYYAVRLDGGRILRLAITTDSIYQLAGYFLFLIAAVLLLAAGLAFAIAKGLTNNIVNLIERIDLNGNEQSAYDELLPFVEKIAAQKQEIDRQMIFLSNKTDTLNSIVENIQEGLLLTDNKGVVLLANNSALTILKEQTAEGKNVAELCRDADFLDKVKTCLAGEKTQTELRRHNKIYSVFCNPVQAGEARGGAAVLFVDTTRWHAAQQQRQEFSANVSHEMKTPLTTICALSEMIGDGMVKPEDVRNFAARINNQARRLVSIIDNIIMIAEFDEGAAEKKYSRFDLRKLSEEVVDGWREKARERSVEIFLTGDGPLYIDANKNMLDQLLYNLLDNAVKYNREGGRVTVSLEKREDKAHISVADTGIGIAPEHLGRVFERFYRVDKARSQKISGAGLGLSIVKHIVEFHRGSMTIDSADNKGTTVTCLI